MRYLGPALVIALPLMLLAWVSRDTEPFYNNDETRHVVTGVFFADALADLPISNPRGYAIDWYLRYPALGILVWPPLFHAIEGLTMSVFGTGYAVARGLIAAFAVASLLQIYRWALLYRSRPSALAIALLVGASPLFVEMSRVVMLEVPSFFFAISAIFHFERYLLRQHRRDALSCGLFAAATALTRFDAFFLAVYFVIRLLPREHRHLFLRPAVLWSAGLALLLTVPYYLATYFVYGDAASHAATAGTSAESSAFPSWGNLTDHPRHLVRSVGWPMLSLALIGMVLLLRRRTLARGMVLGLIAAVYLSFSPLAEREARYAIYWLPAWAWLACHAIQTLARKFRPRWVSLAALSAAVLATLAVTLNRPIYQVSGYRYAAEWVLAQPAESPVVFVDAYLNGDFIYQVCQIDKSRQRQVLRGDKLLYGVISDPHGGYRDHATTEAEVLEILARYDPEYLVIEEPQVRFVMPGATLLRATLHEHPERFRLVKSIPLETDYPAFRGVRLEVWHQIGRNPDRKPLDSLPMLNLDRPLKRSKP